ncbi:MAG: D-lactate dehydrogenase VanH [Syntrophomonadaceae bacterium]|jgi:D-specific alpha-keto acid dehydrogenase|nr:D-lactate dehydrogenase VanH [Syntrophomonadaceae bacterium]
MKNIGITVYGCEQDEANMFRSLSPRFGVTPAIIGGALTESNAALVPGNQCISVGHKYEVPRSVIFSLKNAGVKYISTRSVGYDHIDIGAAERMGIAVGNVEYSPGSVADYTIMLMLLAVRNAKTVVSSAERNDFRLNSIRAKELRDMTVGVIGAGRIGRAVIERLRGFGCHVLAYDRNWEAAAEYVPIDELLRKSDIVTLHLPFNADTRHIIGRGQLRKMKQGAFIVNTGRGTLVDTGALIKALRNGKLGGAALDVLEGERGIFYFDCSQKPIDNQFLLQLQSMPNVIITPHTAYHTERVLRDTVEKTITNCLDFERSLIYG